MLMLSFAKSHDVLVHLDGVDIPDHLVLGYGSNSSQLLEETVLHLLVKLGQLTLYLVFTLADCCHDVLGVLGHIFLELELQIEVFLLLELHVA